MHERERDRQIIYLYTQNQAEKSEAFKGNFHPAFNFQGIFIPISWAAIYNTIPLAHRILCFVYFLTNSLLRDR